MSFNDPNAFGSQPRNKEFGDAHRHGEFDDAPRPQEGYSTTTRSNDYTSGDPGEVGSRAAGFAGSGTGGYTDNSSSGAAIESHDPSKTDDYRSSRASQHDSTDRAPDNQVTTGRVHDSFNPTNDFNRDKYGSSPVDPTNTISGAPLTHNDNVERGTSNTDNTDNTGNTGNANTDEFGAADRDTHVGDTNTPRAGTYDTQRGDNRPTMGERVEARSDSHTSGDRGEAGSRAAAFASPETGGQADNTSRSSINEGYDSSRTGDHGFSKTIQYGSADRTRDDNLDTTGGVRDSSNAMGDSNRNKYDPSTAGPTGVPLTRQDNIDHSTSNTGNYGNPDTDNFGAADSDTYGRGTNATGAGTNDADHTGNRKPTVGEKIKGKMETMGGKLTKNPELVERGQERKTGNVEYH
ncbi:hypothetical protein CTheo_3225 [Ceratobasidium theobromae]|uniref:Uncharacterized protein n=1 Tax=Ceratobasidium theobromae TaxID=1582974 RepID=A0A5N5QQ03_9AGAM|nr:hypothetical protein CTheo_3225 [Ceratobasidium theobromae]